MQVLKDAYALHLCARRSSSSQEHLHPSTDLPLRHLKADLPQLPVQLWLTRKTMFYSWKVDIAIHDPFLLQLLVRELLQIRVERSIDFRRDDLRWHPDIADLVFGHPGRMADRDTIDESIVVLRRKVETRPPTEAEPDYAELRILLAQLSSRSIDRRAPDRLVVPCFEGGEVETSTQELFIRLWCLFSSKAIRCKQVQQREQWHGRDSQVWQVNGTVDFLGVEIGKVTRVDVDPALDIVYEEYGSVFVVACDVGWNF